MALLLHIPASACTKQNWGYISFLFPRIPNLEHTFWTTRNVLFVVSTKTPEALCTAISQEDSFHIG
jgi:hypothetical protein